MLVVETTYHIPDLPCKLALLADTHGRDQSPALESLRVHRPSLICIAGDILYGVVEDDQSPLTTQTNVLPFLRACASIAPTFLSLGNHEWMLDDEDLSLLSATGVTVLDNEWVENEGLVIGGLTSPYCLQYRAFRTSQNASGGLSVRYPKRESTNGAKRDPEASERHPDTSWLGEFAAVEGYHILLSHEPQYFPLLPSNALVLSAHAHGGQIRMYNPFKVNVKPCA